MVVITAGKYLRCILISERSKTQKAQSDSIYTTFRNRTEQDLVLGEEGGGLQRDLRKVSMEMVYILIAVEVVVVGT